MQYFSRMVSQLWFTCIDICIRIVNFESRMKWTYASSLSNGDVIIIEKYLWHTHVLWSNVITTWVFLTIWPALWDSDFIKHEVWLLRQIRCDDIWRLFTNVELYFFLRVIDCLIFCMRLRIFLNVPVCSGKFSNNKWSSAPTANFARSGNEEALTVFCKIGVPYSLEIELLLCVSRISDVGWETLGESKMDVLALVDSLSAFVSLDASVAGKLSMIWKV